MSADKVADKARRETVGGSRVVWLDSLDDAVETAESSEGGASRKEGASETWDLGAGYAGAVELAQVGWTDAVEQVQSLVRDIRNNVGAAVQPVWDTRVSMTGPVLDIDAYSQGNPYCFIEPVLAQVSKHGRIIKVVVVNSASAGVDANVIRDRGAAIATLLDILAITQHGMELWVVNAVTRRDSQHETMVRIANPQEPWNIAKVMFAVAHPAMLRRIVFGVQETEPNKVRGTFGFTTGGGYGSPRHNTVAAIDTLGDCITVPRMTGSTLIERDPTAWIVEQLKTLGLWKGGE